MSRAGRQPFWVAAERVPLVRAVFPEGQFAPPLEAPSKQAADWDRDAALRRIRTIVRDRTRRATTTGYGPRFLHSTGQLHKGGPPGGRFLQLVSDNPDDLAIPDDFGAAPGSTGFGVLKNAQSIGDLRALEAAGRRVVRVRLGGEGPGVAAALRAIARALRELP